MELQYANQFSIHIARTIIFPKSFQVKSIKEISQLNILVMFTLGAVATIVSMYSTINHDCKH